MDVIPMGLHPRQNRPITQITDRIIEPLFDTTRYLINFCGEPPEAVNERARLLRTSLSRGPRHPTPLCSRGKTYRAWSRSDTADQCGRRLHPAFVNVPGQGP